MRLVQCRENGQVLVNTTMNVQMPSNVDICLSVEEEFVCQK